MTPPRRDPLARLRVCGFACLALVLASCATPPSGVVSPGFTDVRVRDAYLPLNARSWMIDHWGAAFIVAPNVAVTNAHNANLISRDSVLAISREYDLLFYHVEGARPAPMAQPYVGQGVVSYGQGRGHELREARGVIRALDATVAAQCMGCPNQRSIAFDAEAGPGFSGGPLVDAKTGAVVAIVFGYREGEAQNGGSRMFAYDIGMVMAEMRRLMPRS